MTNRETVARIRSMLKMTSGDDLISDRAILADLKSCAILYIKRETDRRKLFTTDSLFTTIPCLPMKEVPIAECCSYKDSCKISRSVDKLPKIADGVWGYLVQGVYSIDGRYKFLEGTAERFVNSQRLNIRTKTDFFWVQNQYLYVSNPNIEAVMFKAYFEDEVNPADYSCGKDKKEPCQNPLDLEFKCPGYLIENVVNTTIDKYTKIYIRSQEDTTDDDIERK